MAHSPHVGFDLTALLWAAGFSLAFSLSLLPDRWRKLPAEERKFHLFWGVIVETMVGGLVGGVAFAVAIPEHVTALRGEGSRAALSVIGAACGPHLGQWVVRGVPQLIPTLAQRLFGVKITLEGKGEGDDGEKKA